MINQSSTENMVRYFVGTMCVTGLTIASCVGNALINHADSANDADYAVYPIIGLAAACAQVGLFAWANRRSMQERSPLPSREAELLLRI